jgi:hypothetical protein
MRMIRSDLAAGPSSSASRRPTEKADTYKNNTTFKKVNSASGLFIVAQRTITSQDTAETLAAWVVQEIDNKA